jgi:hypothetical protein
MNKLSEMDNLTKVTRRRYFDDGLVDFVFGVTILIIGLFVGYFFSPIGMTWFFTNLYLNREITIIALVSLVPLFFLFVMGLRRLIDWIRRNTLWKNQGFIRPLRWQVSWKINMLASFVFIAMIIIAVWLMVKDFISKEDVLRTLVSSAGLATGIVFYGMGKEISLKRYKWNGITGGLISALIILIPISFSSSWLVLGIMWVMIFTISGLSALIKALEVIRGQEGG